MASLKRARNELFLAYDDGTIDDEEFCLLYDINQSNNLIFVHADYEKFDLDNKDDVECISDFRV